MDNIAGVIRDGLCTGCGTCAGVCPTDAIAMRVSNGLLLPEVSVDKCTNCGLCLKCCSGYYVNFEKLNSSVFGRQPEDASLGNYLKCYVGHSNDEEIRFNSSSGGVAIQLLVFALERNLIDGALVVRMRKDKPLEPEAFIARTREDILSSSKSKYCPVPMNMALKEILAEDGKFAIVGLPCHIWGLRMAEALVKNLMGKIILSIGLFCCHTVDFTGTEFLLNRVGVGRGEVAKLDYRGKGWPGSMRIQLRDGRNLNLRFVRGWSAYWNVFSPFFFTPLRCMMCSDLFNELADISVGDAWLPELRSCTHGESVIVARTRTAEEILTLMKKRSMITIREISPIKAKESQAFSLNFKKENLAGRLHLLNMLVKRTPKIVPTPHSSSFWAFTEALLAYFSFHASSKKRLRALLFYVPLPLFRIYFGMFRYISLLSQNSQTFAANEEIEHREIRQVQKHCLK